MRTREKLTLEEKFALALALIKRDQTLEEIRLQYRVSHTTAYKIRNAFLEGGRAALSGDRRGAAGITLEARVRAIEARLERTGRTEWGLDGGVGAAASRGNGAGSHARGRDPDDGDGAEQ
ncbi:hypothetical protein L6Q96_12820 [Candidatus Binatia bacterium]|nr:hypothetical protein [Candidatus Binatia bacterium]